MTRLIAGAAGGRRLAAPPGRTTRPTSDRTREGLFATVGSLLGPLEGRRVLDLFAGSGAVGLEAASRGASHVLLVESDPAALRTIRANVRSTALPGVEVARHKVVQLLRTQPAEPYALVFADPPYAVADSTVSEVLVALHDRHWLAPGALVVVERPRRGPAVSWPPGYVSDRVRTYGDAALWYGLRA